MRSLLPLVLLLSGSVCAFAAPDSVVTFNELNYHPAEDGGGAEWIEVHNQMSIGIDLGGWSIRGGVDYDFADGTVLGAGEYLVVSGAEGEPEGSLGPFEGRLDNGGEELRLRDRNGRVMDRLDYNDRGDWPAEADGAGKTLAKRHGDLGSGRVESWTASLEDGGTPGARNFERPLEGGASRTLFGEGGTWRWTAEEVAEGWEDVRFNDRGWATGAGYSGEDQRVRVRRLFAYSGGLEGAEVLVRGVLDGEATFVLNGVEAGAAEGGGAFAVRIAGDLLVVGANLLAVELDGTRFDAGAVAVEVGGDLGQVAAHVAGEVVINEIHYHPAPTYADPRAGVAYAEDGLEWVELHNRSGADVDLSGWRLRGGIGYDFPEGSLLTGGGFLVVDGTEFSGSLGNGGDVLRLRSADGGVVDEVEYFDSGRWPSHADGGGSTLELLDPDSDNRLPEAWAASDESVNSEWVEYRYRSNGAEPPGSNNPDVWKEFLFGLLDAGEVLVDDVSVIESPDGSSRQLIQNGTFEGDTIGGGAARWRLLGTHRESRVVRDPDGAGKVLRIVATGEQTHTYNTVSTTLAGNRTIRSGRTYEISFRAKWLSGSPQLNTRLYLNRAAKTHILRQPDLAGTPGEGNRGAVSNLGPTFGGFRHFPAVPGAGEAVQVSASLSDDDGIASARVYYSTGGGAWESVVMGGDSGGGFLGILPGANGGDVVHFYAEAVDGAGAVSRFPAGGAESRALYRVGDGGVSGQRPKNKMRLVMLETEASAMHTERDAVSNYRWGGTLIYNDEAVYYDVGVRLRGAPFGRRGRPGWNIRFGDDRPFRGVHSSVVIDGALNMPKGDGTGWITTTSGVSVNEMLFNVVGNRAGGVGSTYDDIVYFEAPRARDSRLAQLKMMRFEPGYLEEFVGDGGRGNFFKQELIYYPDGTQTGNPEAAKNGFSRVNQVDITSMGRERDAYRFNYLLRTNRAQDDFSGIVAMCEAFDRSGGALAAATEAAIDVDNWMRTLALNALFGVADTYNNGLAHNFAFYQRATDGKVMAFPWDLDHACYYAVSDNIFGRGTHRVRAVIDLPQNRRRFLGHLLDFCENGFDPGYLSPRLNDLSQVAEQNYQTILLNWVSRRRAFVLSEIRRLQGEIDFAVTSNGGEPFSTGQAAVTLRGQGWVDVREIRLVRDGVGGEGLEVGWVGGDTWQVVVPLFAGTNDLVLEALNHQGEVVGSDSITVTNTGPREPGGEGNLVISEVMYHPAPPSDEEVAAGYADADAFEWIELANVGEREIELAGVRFGNGIEYVFGASVLGVGERLVLARDAEAFALRYPGVSVAGEFALGLANGGERLELLDRGGGTIVDFAYGDRLPWPEEADGEGYSLTLIEGGDGKIVDDWRPSALPGGTPGGSDSMPLLDGSELIDYALAGLPEIEAADGFVFSWKQWTGADAVRVIVQTGSALEEWSSGGVELVEARSTGDGARSMSVRVTDPQVRFLRLRVEER